LKLKKPFLTLLTTMMSASLVLSACGGSSGSGGSSGADQNDPNKPAPENKDPITLKWSYNFGEETFKTYIKEPIEKKFPHITIELIKAQSLQLKDHVAAKNIPDIITHDQIAHADSMDEFGLRMDMMPLVQSKKFDLSRFEPTLIEYIQSFSPNKELIAFPLSRAPSAMFYNKDIFDKFNVPYPKDGMKWDEVVELAKRLTKKEGDIQYIGLDPDISSAWSQLDITHVDPKTDKPLLDSNPDVRKYFELADKLYNIPGILPSENPSKGFHDSGNRFVSGKVAMIALWDLSGWLIDVSKQGKGFNWDIVTFPEWSHRPGIGKGASSHAISISPASKYQDQAFDVLAYLFSDEYQMMRSKSGYASPLVNPDIMKAFASDIEGWKGKNTQANFKLKPNPYPAARSKYEAQGSIIWWASEEFAKRDKDVNTMIRLSQERADKAIKDKKAKE